MIKRIVFYFVAVAFFTSIFSVNCIAQQKNHFYDISGNEYFAKAAESLSELSIITGYEDQTFGGEKLITRAEMTVIICRLLEINYYGDIKSGYKAFDDVPSGHWAEKYIMIAASNGIVSGDGNGKFRPEDNVLYEEAIKMIVCAFKIEGYAYKDNNDWATPYIKAAQNNNFLDGNRGKRGVAISRGDIAIIIYNGLTGQVSEPKFSLEAGIYTGEQYVEIYPSDPDVSIYYTNNGKSPITDGVLFRSPISITESCTIKAVAVRNNVLYSSVVENKYLILAPKYKLYAINSVGGSISLSEGAYEEDDSISVRAYPNDGYVFECWVSYGGGEFIDPYDAKTDFIMPNNDVEIWAVFKKEINIEEFKKEVVRLVNAEREKVGVGALKINKLLESTAQQHSEDMLENDFFDHTNLNGESPFDRMRKNGINYMSAAENIAYGQDTPEEVMTSWMNSDGHRANILNASYTEIGVGIAISDNGIIYWTQNFIGGGY